MKHLLLTAAILLAAHPAAAKTTFLIAGHTRAAGNIAVHQALKETVSSLVKSQKRPDYVLLLGDIIRNGGDSIENVRHAWKLVFEVLQPLEAKVLAAAGNHDVGLEGSRIKNENGIHLWRELFPDLAYTVALEREETLLTFLYLPDDDNAVIENDNRRVLEAALKRPAKLRFLFMHVLPHFAKDGPAHAQVLYSPSNGAVAKSNWWNEIEPVIRGKVQAVFCGNATRTTYWKHNGIQYYATGFNTTFQPSGPDFTMLLLEIKEGRYEVTPMLHSSFIEDFSIAKDRPAYVIDPEAADNTAAAIRLKTWLRHIRKPWIALAAFMGGVAFAGLFYFLLPCFHFKAPK